MCGYYKRYIRDFSKHSAPLFELVRKGEPYVWDGRRQNAFDYLKSKLVSATILGMSQDEGQFILDVDASDWAAGAVLQQEQNGELRVIAYASRTFNEHELNYCITRKELAALIFGLKNYRQYLLGRFVVRTDHATLTYMRTSKDLIGQQARWLDLMEEYNFEIRHRAGTLHGNADSLSRMIPCEKAGGPCLQCHKHERQKKSKYTGDAEEEGKKIL